MVELKAVKKGQKYAKQDAAGAWYPAAIAEKDCIVIDGITTSPEVLILALAKLGYQTKKKNRGHK